MKKKLSYIYVLFCANFLVLKNVKAETCSNLLSDLLDEIREIFNLLGYVTLAIGIVLGMFDFFKTITGGDKAELKVVAQKFVKRLLAISLFFILPALVNWLLELSGIPHGGTCLE